MKYLLALLVAVCALGASAQNKLDFDTRLWVEGASATDRLTVLVELSDENAIPAGSGLDVENRIGNICIISATPAQIEQLAALPAVVSVSASKENKALTPAGPTIAPAAPKKRYVAPRSPGIFGGLHR